MAEEYDGIIIGAGPNGLTVAAYLAKAGLKILVLEKNFEAGGGLATEQVTLPGFLHNTHAVYMPMVDYAPPLQGLRRILDQRLRPGIRVSIARDGMPFADGSSLRLYRDVDKTCESIARNSPKDAETYRRIADRYQGAHRRLPRTCHVRGGQAGLRADGDAPADRCGAGNHRTHRKDSTGHQSTNSSRTTR